MSTAGDWVPQPNSAPAVEHWREALIKGRNGPAPLLANAITALRRDPAWSDVFAFDEFALSASIRKESPLGGDRRVITDHEERLTADWLQHNGVLVSPEVAGQAIQVVARDRMFHPVRDYLNGLTWDGTKRIGGWLNLYLGVEPSEYSVAVGAAFLTGAAARIQQPGCKLDTVIILEGEQGIKKSTALKTMFWPWFTDEIADISSKDASLQILGVWGVEFAELDSLTRAESSKIKAFTSRSVDRFRPPYGRHLIETPRQCVFAGSVNHNAYLRDETGARRFLPVRCTRILIQELERDRDQLWAEAMAAYTAGASWWLQGADLIRASEGEQAARYEGSAWDSLIMPWAEEQIRRGAKSVGIPEILERCINKPAKEWSKADEMRVGSCLRQGKWQRYRDRREGWRYRPPVPALVGTDDEVGTS